jgi:hypothetical protein
VITVEDIEGNSRNLVINLLGMIQTGSPMPGDGPKPSGPQSGRLKPDRALLRIQQFLIKEDYAVGPHGADGLWSVDTRQAIIKYLKENFTDLKQSKFRDKFKNMSEPPDFSTETQGSLRAYMEVLI